MSHGGGSLYHWAYNGTIRSDNQYSSWPLFFSSGHALQQNSSACRLFAFFSSPPAAAMPYIYIFFFFLNEREREKLLCQPIAGDISQPSEKMRFTLIYAELKLFAAVYQSSAYINTTSAGALYNNICITKLLYYYYIYIVELRPITIGYIFIFIYYSSSMLRRPLYYIQGQCTFFYIYVVLHTTYDGVVCMYILYCWGAVNRTTASYNSIVQQHMSSYMIADVYRRDLSVYIDTNIHLIGIIIVSNRPSTLNIIISLRLIDDERYIYIYRYSNCFYMYTKCLYFPPPSQKKQKGWIYTTGDCLLLYIEEKYIESN